jgi:hypothetical protein
MQPLSFVVLLSAVIPIVWIGSLYLISLIGPWGALSKQYPYVESISGTSHWFVSLKAGPVSYSNCLTAVSNSRYLTLRALLPLRPFHPPITLPRSAVTNIVIDRFLFVPTVSFMICDQELRLFGSVASSAFWQSA